MFFGGADMAFARGGKGWQSRCAGRVFQPPGGPPKRRPHATHGAPRPKAQHATGHPARAQAQRAPQYPAGTETGDAAQPARRKSPVHAARAPARGTIARFGQPAHDAAGQSASAGGKASRVAPSRIPATGVAPAGNASARLAPARRTPTGEPSARMAPAGTSPAGMAPAAPPTALSAPAASELGPVLLVPELGLVFYRRGGWINAGLRDFAARG